jgi:Domain of unknown function (DUF6378)
MRLGPFKAGQASLEGPDAHNLKSWSNFVADATAELLAERAKTHGSFEVHARVTQDLKTVIEHERLKWESLCFRHQEALHMITHKIGRIMAGDPNWKDHWDDIAGYAKLGSEACE